MTTLLRSSVLVLLFACPHWAAPIQKICFSRGNAIYVKDVGSGAIRKVTVGSDPDISPDGRAVAYTRNLDSASPDQPNRLIEVIDLATSRVRRFGSFDRYTQYHPLWSPDGKRVAFNILIDSAWRVGLVDLASGEWRVLTKGTGEAFLSSWTLGGESLVCQDLNNVYVMDVGGHVLKQIPVGRLSDETNISSSTTFSLSADGKLLLFDLDGPPSAKHPRGESGVVLYDLEARKLKRLTPEGSGPRWLPSGEGVVYTVVSKRGVPSLYEVSLAGTARLLVENASDGSVSARE